VLRNFQGLATFTNFAPSRLFVCGCVTRQACKNAIFAQVAPRKGLQIFIPSIRFNFAPLAAQPQTGKQRRQKTAIVTFCTMPKNKFYFFRLPLYRFTAFSFYKVENLFCGLGCFPSSCQRTQRLTMQKYNIFRNLQSFFSIIFQKVL